MNNIIKNTIRVQYVNYWTDPFNDRWLLHFIKNIYKNKYNVIEVKNCKDCDILICSVVGDINNVKKYNAKLKIFFYGENLNLDCFKQYGNINQLQEYFDLIIGFLPTDLNKKLIRFPLWFMYYPFYEMTNDTNNIIDYIKNERNKNIKIKKEYFATLIARHSNLGIRKLICDNMSKHGKIMYPSKFRKNCSIGPEPNDKINFLKKVKYNICPENSKFPEYYTEKIFHALESGCVPIYWAINLPEKDIINPECYKFINIENKKLMKSQIKEVIENYDNYINTNIFTENAKEVVNNYYKVLEENIEKCYM